MYGGCPILLFVETAILRENKNNIRETFANPVFFFRGGSPSLETIKPCRDSISKYKCTECFWFSRRMLQTGSWCWSKISLAHVFLHVYPWCSATTQAEDAYSFFVRCSTIMKKQAYKKKELE